MQLDLCVNIKINNINNNLKTFLSGRPNVTLQSYSQFDANNKMIPFIVLYTISNKVKQSIEDSDKKRR